MRLLFSSMLSIVALGTSAGMAEQPPSAADIANAQKMAAEYMNNPAYQEQIKKIQKQMRAQGLNPDQMQEGMKNMQSMNPKNMDAMVKMSKCVMDGIGEKDMKKMEARSQQVTKQIETLCAKGKTAEAEKTAKAYAGEMLTSREYRTMKNCSEKYKDAFNDPALQDMKKHMQQMEGKKEKLCS